MLVNEKKLDVITSIMKEQLRWTRLAGMSQLRTILDTHLDTESKRIMYELSDGERSIRDIEKIVGIGRTKIASLWRRWYQAGIMEPSEKYEGRRMQKSFSLADAGIEVSIPDNDERNTEEFE